MISVYEFKTGSEPKYTTFTDHFKNCIDYIFVSDDVEIINVKEYMNKIENWNMTGKFMPNDEFPADHINLVTTIKL